MLGKQLSVGTVAAADHHPIFEDLAFTDQARGKVSNGEAVCCDEFTKLFLWHDSFAFEPKMMVSIELAWQPILDDAEEAQDRQRGNRAENCGHPEADTYKNTDGGGHPYGGSRRQSTNGEPSLKITPAPRNPMPVMIPCAIRVGSVRMASSATCVIHSFW